MARATAFGLDLLADPLPAYLVGAAPPPTGRALGLALLGEGEEAPEWPADAELISDQRQADGSVVFQIEAAAGAGYRIGGPLYGTSVIGPVGESLRGTLGEGGIAAWQRLLVAQALPFAAVLQGLDVLHASGVVIGDGAVALIGPSGAGKTSLALALWRRGAGLLTDDVVAVERAGEELICHPGAAVAGVEREEARRLEAAGVLGGGDWLDGNEREQIVAVSLNPGPAPLRALFLLDRRADGPPEPRFEPLANAQILLGSTFNLVIGSPQRLERLLDVCALAARQRVERVIVGAETSADDLAGAIEQRLGATL